MPPAYRRCDGTRQHRWPTGLSVWRGQGDRRSFLTSLVLRLPEPEDMCNCPGPAVGDFVKCHRATNGTRRCHAILGQRCTTSACSSSFFARAKRMPSMWAALASHRAMPSGGNRQRRPHAFERSAWGPATTRRLYRSGAVRESAARGSRQPAAAGRQFLEFSRYHTGAETGSETARSRTSCPRIDPGRHAEPCENPTTSHHTLSESANRDTADGHPSRASQTIPYSPMPFPT